MASRACVCVCAVSITATKDGVKFSTSGDVGTANITVRQNNTADKVRPDVRWGLRLPVWAVCRCRATDHTHAPGGCALCARLRQCSLTGPVVAARPCLWVLLLLLCLNRRRTRCR